MWHPQLLGRDLGGTHVMHNLTSEPHAALHQEDLMCGCNLAQPSPTAGETPHGCICVYCPQEGCALCFGGLPPPPPVVTVPWSGGSEVQTILGSVTPASKAERWKGIRRGLCHAPFDHPAGDHAGGGFVRCRDLACQSEGHWKWTMGGGAC